eukprot:199077-Lingulodinium_polyedra.AAC.1
MRQFQPNPGWREEYAHIVWADCVDFLHIGPPGVWVVDAPTSSVVAMAGGRVDRDRPVEAMDDCGN